jgi:hypothetical protein
MSPRRRSWLALTLGLVAAAVWGFAGSGPGQDESFPPAAYAKARLLLSQVQADLDKIEAEILVNDRTIKKAEDIIALARQKNNAQAETAAREAQRTAREAKAKNEATRARLQDSRRAAQAGLSAAQETMSRWVKEYRDLIAGRLDDAGTVYNHILDSLRSRKTPPAPQRGLSELRSGDVLLVAPPDGYAPGALASKGLMYVDKLTSWEWGEGSSRASHSLIYLKTVNGRKLFLDDQLGEGPRIKTEEMILKEYEGRSMDVAQPIARPDAEKLWTAARQLEVQNLAHLDQSPVGASTYNLYGDDHMVCSEASRWALVQAQPPDAAKIEDTGSPFKKSLGVFFGPANFYGQPQHFVVSALDVTK